MGLETDETQGRFMPLSTSGFTSMPISNVIVFGNGTFGGGKFRWSHESRVSPRDWLTQRGKGEGCALCVHVRVYMNIWNFVCHQRHRMRITREEISINNPDRELGSHLVTSRTQ